MPESAIVCLMLLCRVVRQKLNLKGYYKEIIELYNGTIWVENYFGREDVIFSWFIVRKLNSGCIQKSVFDSRSILFSFVEKYKFYLIDNMARSKSSNQWMQEHFDDEYVKKAQALGYRSRSTFKLVEIQEKDKIIKPGMNVVDLGAAPGGWSDYARKIVGKKNKVIALDLLAIDPIDGVDFIQGDFREDEVLAELYRVLEGAPVDLIMSDMAPNISGNKEMDQPRSIYLAELALDAAQTVLTKGGTFLIKMFQGAGFDEYKRDVGNCFSSVVIRKPKSSRARSKEVYILAKGFKK